MGTFRKMHYRGRPPGIAKLLLLDGNTVFRRSSRWSSQTPVVFLLVELIAEDHGGDGERADDEVENVQLHSLVTPFSSQKRAF